MTIVFHKQFEKQVKKLSSKEQLLLKDRLQLFRLDPHHSRLRNHPLTGRYLNYRSIDIRPDLRALYKEVDDTAIFVYLGSHSQLYA